jgi:hypothetical protein
MSKYKLIREIIERSEADNWDEAKPEWELAEVYDQREPDECLCGHFPINEICILRNRKNGRLAKVGNVCVKKFLGLPSDRILKGLRRIVVDDSKALNVAATEYAYERGWIDKWERGFCLDTARKRKLTQKQLHARRRINQKVLRKAPRLTVGV